MVSEAVWETGKGVFLRVIVKPMSKEREFLTVNVNDIVANLKNPARDGKANTELVKRLSKHLGLSSSNVTLVSGYKSREKTVLIQGLDRIQVLQKLKLLHN
ncbi:MAG: DUF167 domain-containing protein [Candidatus Thorarchaeota archaeon]|jgi:uncharacterized protein (TIGR00251 family)